MPQDRKIALTILLFLAVLGICSMFLFWQFSKQFLAFDRPLIDLLYFPGIIFIPPVAYFIAWILLDVLNGRKKQNKLVTLFKKNPRIYFILLYLLSGIISFFSYNFAFTTALFASPPAGNLLLKHFSILFQMILGMAIFPISAASFFFFTGDSNIDRITRIILTIILFASFPLSFFIFII